MRSSRSHTRMIISREMGMLIASFFRSISRNCGKHMSPVHFGFMRLGNMEKRPIGRIITSHYSVSPVASWVAPAISATFAAQYVHRFLQHGEKVIYTSDHSAWKVPLISRVMLRRNLRGTRTVYVHRSHVCRTDQGSVRGQWMRWHQHYSWRNIEGQTYLRRYQRTVRAGRWGGTYGDVFE